MPHTLIFDYPSPGPRWGCRHKNDSEWWAFAPGIDMQISQCFSHRTLDFSGFRRVRMNHHRLLRWANEVVKGSTSWTGSLFTTWKLFGVCGRENATLQPGGRLAILCNVQDVSGFALKSAFGTMMNNHRILMVSLIPHITVWGSCFSLGFRRSPPASAGFRLPPRRLTIISPHFSSHTTATHHSSTLTPHQSHLSSHLTHHTTTHHSSTSHTSPITSLIASSSSHHNSSQFHFSHTTSLITSSTSHHNSSQLHFSHLTYHISHHSLLITPQLAWPPLGRS